MSLTLVLIAVMWLLVLVYAWAIFSVAKHGDRNLPTARGGRGAECDKDPRNR